MPITDKKDPTLELTRQLIARPSVTPADSGCQELMGERLARAGFVVENMRFGDVDNLWATRGEQGPLLVFAGHTDVVPPGDMATWQSDPFEATVAGDELIGRGAAAVTTGRRGATWGHLYLCQRYHIVGSRRQLERGGFYTLSERANVALKNTLDDPLTN